MAGERRGKVRADMSPSPPLGCDVGRLHAGSLGCRGLQRLSAEDSMQAGRWADAGEPLPRPHPGCTWTTAYYTPTTEATASTLEQDRRRGALR